MAPNLFDMLQVSYALFQLATEAAQAGPKGKGKKRTRSGQTAAGAPVFNSLPLPSLPSVQKAICDQMTMAKAPLGWTLKLTLEAREQVQKGASAL